MSFESDFQQMLATATSKVVFWDTTPAGYKITDAIIVLQQTGGKAQFFYEKTQVPSHKHARIMVRCIGRKREEVAPLARLVEDTIAKSSYPSEPYGAFIADMSPDLEFFDSAQQFGIWFADP